MINNSQARREAAKKQKNELNASYENGMMSYSTYLKKWKVAHSKYKNANSIYNQMKDNGVKVTKVSAAYYMYNGKNFSVSFNEDACVSVFWEVNIDDEDTPQFLTDEFREFNQFERKADVVNVLFGLDTNMGL